MTETAPATLEKCFESFYMNYEHYSMIDFEYQPNDKTDIMILAVNKKYGFMLHLIMIAGADSHISNCRLIDMPLASQPVFLAMYKRSHVTVENVTRYGIHHDELTAAIPSVCGDFVIWFDGKKYKKTVKKDLHLYAILTQDAGEGYKVFSCFWSLYKNLTDETDSRLPYKLDAISSKILIKKL